MQLLFWSHVHLDLAFPIDDPSTEVPWQIPIVVGVLLSTKFGGVLAEILEDGVRFWPIHYHFIHEGEFDAKILLRLPLDDWVGVWLLTHELVAGEAEDL